MSKFSKDYVFTEGKTSLFHNFSDEAFPNEQFPCTWANRPIRPIPAGKTVDMPQYLAFHCAKHLADREIFKKSVIDGKDPILNGDLKDQFMQKALIGEGKESGDTSEEIGYNEVPDEVPELIEKTPEDIKSGQLPEKNKGGRPNKVVEENLNPKFEE